MGSLPLDRGTFKTKHGIIIVGIFSAEKNLTRGLGNYSSSEGNCQLALCILQFHWKVRG